jgi:hypothetical protein
MNVTQNLSGATDTALIHEPKAVPRAPKIIAHLKPYKKKKKKKILIRKTQSTREKPTKKKPTWNGLGWNPRLHSERQGTNHLTHGMAYSQLMWNITSWMIKKGL